MQRLISKSFPDIYKMCSSPATLRFGAFALGQHAGITSFKLTVIKKIEIFGSYARGEQKETSDLDVVVEFEKRKSLLELVGIKQELEDNLGIKIDLLTEDSINPYLIEKNQKRIQGDIYKTKIVEKEEAEREKRR